MMRVGGFLLTVLLLVSGTAAPALPAPGAGQTAMRLESVLDSPPEREALILYAKGVLLARLGFGPRVEPPPAAASLPGACFVTFFVGRQVVACFGGFQPRTANLAAEIDENVRLALLYDARARGLDRRRALAADVQITFPDPPEPVSAPSLVDPLREGLFVENDSRGVAIVPGEAKTSAWGYRSAMKRLGETDPLRVRLYRFRAAVISSRHVADGAMKKQ